MIRGLGTATLICFAVGCQGISDNDASSNTENIGAAESAIVYPSKRAVVDTTTLATNLSATTFKDITASSSFFYALTTTGIKRVTHAAIGTIGSAAHLTTVQIDAIDYANSTYGVVGARAKGSNPNAILVLRADTTSPVSIALPTSVTSVSDLQVRQISSSVIRIYIKTYQPPTYSTIKEFEYNGTTLTYITQQDQGYYSNAGFTFVASNSFYIGWSSYVDTSAFKRYFPPNSLTTEIGEAQDYDRTYPGGDTTAFVTHGYSVNGQTKVLDPRQVDFAYYNGSTSSIFALVNDTSTTSAIVRMDYGKLIFNKTPTFTPGYWNVSGIQSSNNCYNYSTNKRTDTFAQPGDASGYPMPRPPYASITTISDAAVHDGLEFLGNPATMPTPPEGKSLIAAIVGIGVSYPDYHWYRKDRSSQYWTHKPGPAAATNLDQKGNVITDPRTAAWNTSMYNQFVGFFLVDSNWFEGKGVENVQ